MEIEPEVYKDFYNKLVKLIAVNELGGIWPKSARKESTKLIWQQLDEDRFNYLFGYENTVSRSRFYFARKFDEFNKSKKDKGEIDDIPFYKALKYVGVEDDSMVENGSLAIDTKALSLLYNKFKKDHIKKPISAESETAITSFDELKHHVKKEYSTINSSPQISSFYLLDPLEISDLIYRILTKDGKLITLTENEFNFYNENKTPITKEIENFLLKGDSKLVELLSASAEYQNKPSIIYDIKNAIINGIPYLFSEITLKILFDYLNIEKIPYKKYKPRRLTNKMSEFENTSWLFFYPTLHKHFKSTKTKVGIGIMEFQSFGKVNYKSKNQEYEGQYNTYGENESYLSIDLKLKDSFMKDLYMLAYCGINKTEVMLGQYHDPSFMASGNMMMLPTSESYDKFRGEHIGQEDENFSRLPDIVRSFFLRGHLDGIMSITEFNKVSYLDEYLKVTK